MDAVAVVTPEQVVTEPAVAPQSVDWTAHIPKDLVSEKVWDSYKGKPIGDVLKSFVDSHKYATGAIRLPNEKDKPEEAQAKLRDLYGKLGRPETPDKYTVKSPELPNGLSLDPSKETAFKGMAHQLNLTNAQVQGLLDWYGQDLIQASDAQQVDVVQARKESEALLKKEWGAAYEKNVALADRSIQHLAGEVLNKDESAQFLGLMAESGMGRNPGFIKMMARLGTYLSEDQLIRGDSPSSDDSVQTQINDLMRKPEYMDRAHPGHDAVVEQVNKLFQLQVNPMRQAMQAF